MNVLFNKPCRYRHEGDPRENSEGKSFSGFKSIIPILNKSINELCDPANPFRRSTHPYHAVLKFLRILIKDASLDEDFDDSTIKYALGTALASKTGEKIDEFIGWWQSVKNNAKAKLAAQYGLKEDPINPPLNNSAQHHPNRNTLHSSPQTHSVASQVLESATHPQEKSPYEIDEIIQELRLAQQHSLEQQKASFDETVNLHISVLQQSLEEKWKATKERFLATMEETFTSVQMLCRELKSSVDALAIEKIGLESEKKALVTELAREKAKVSLVEQQKKGLEARIEQLQQHLLQQLQPPHNSELNTTSGQEEEEFLEFV